MKSLALIFIRFNQIVYWNWRLFFNLRYSRWRLVLKNLGFFLKRNSYRVKDWFWLIKNIEMRISNWDFRFLSLGGMLTLIKATLKSINVYWCSLVKLPISIIKSIRNFFSLFMDRFGFKDKISFGSLGNFGYSKSSGRMGYKKYVII